MERKSEIDGQENSDGNKKMDLTPDVIFSFFVHKTEVLSRLLKDNITELGDLEPEEIKKFLIATNRILSKSMEERRFTRRRIGRESNWILSSMSEFPAKRTRR